MPNHFTFVVRVGAGVVLGGVGTLASPWSGMSRLHAECTSGTQGGASAPTPHPHHSRPYATWNHSPDCFWIVETLQICVLQCSGLYYFYSFQHQKQV